FWTANCAQITSTNQKAINGIVHQVDRVLTTATGTLWELLSESQQFSKFLSLIDDELRQRLMNSDEHLTVLAFTDDEFNRLPATVLQAIVGRSKCLKDLISEHIFPNTLCSVAVNGSVKIQNIAGHFISASLSANDDERSSHLKFEGVNVTEADRIATNGVLHVIDGVILLEHMLDTLEALRQRHATNFARLLVENDLDIQNCSEVTVFVPPERSLQTLKAEDIKKTLETHIFTELIELKPRQNLEENDSIAISQSGDIFKLSIGSDVLQFPFTDFLDTINAHIGCSQIVASNVRTCNGIVHFIDKPLTSANLTVFELLKSRSDISQFVNMLKLSSLKNKIDEEDFRGTILAPSNDAIGAVFSGDQKQTLLGDSKKLDLFVKRHIISEVLCEHQLNSAAGPLALSRHRSLAGEVIQGRHSGEKFQIGQSPVSESELRATNGIVYILDRPIMRRLSSLWDIFDFAPDIHSVSDLFDI
uniref:FAS1 domain-containing protein n=1 Tax=Plectus sambesii TaxID=2011161 RepID=A0A914X3Z0_9BILA